MIAVTTTTPEQTLSINKVTPTQNPTRTPENSSIETIIDNLVKMPIDTVTVTSINTYATTSTTIRIDTVLAASTKYIKVIYLTITKLDLMSKVYG